MIIMKESSGASFQYRAFENLPAVSRFFEGNTSGKVFPRTLYNGMKIIKQPELTTENLSKWTPINASAYIGDFELIRADASDIEVPENLKWHDGRSETFGKGQYYIPDVIVPRAKARGLLRVFNPNKPVVITGFSLHRGWYPIPLHEGRKPPYKVYSKPRCGRGRVSIHKIYNGTHAPTTSV